MTELREAYRAAGMDLLKLLFFVEINAIGLRKILKKFDKRFGYRFTNYYVKTRANHPYSQLQQVFKHVVMCQKSEPFFFFSQFFKLVISMLSLLHIFIILLKIMSETVNL